MDNYQNIINSQEEIKDFPDEAYTSAGEVSSQPGDASQRINKHPLLTIQLVVAICVLLFLFILKFTGSSLFVTIIDWYRNTCSESLIYSGDSDEFDYSKMFATEDEV